MHTHTCAYPHLYLHTYTHTLILPITWLSGSTAGSNRCGAASGASPPSAAATAASVGPLQTSGSNTCSQRQRCSFAGYLLAMPTQSSVLSWNSTLCLSCSTVALDRELSTLQYHLQSVATTGNFLFQNHPQSSRVTISKLSLSTAVSIPHPQVIKCVIQTNFIIITPIIFSFFLF